MRATLTRPPNQKGWPYGQDSGLLDTPDGVVFARTEREAFFCRLWPCYVVMDVPCWCFCTEHSVEVKSIFSHRLSSGFVRVLSELNLVFCPCRLPSSPARPSSSLISSVCNHQPSFPILILHSHLHSLHQKNRPASDYLLPARSSLVSATSSLTLTVRSI